MHAAGVSMTTWCHEDSPRPNSAFPSLCMKNNASEFSEGGPVNAGATLSLVRAPVHSSPASTD